MFNARLDGEVGSHPWDLEECLCAEYQRCSDLGRDGDGVELRDQCDGGNRWGMGLRGGDEW